MTKQYLNIIVRGKEAVYATGQPPLICGNKNYRIRFAFDEEWADHETKVARFISKGEYIDIEFKGDEVDVPPQVNTFELKVGVYTDGGPFTTTSAVIPCKPSVLCEEAEPSIENDGRYLDEARELVIEAREILAKLGNGEGIADILEELKSKANRADVDTALAHTIATVHVAELPTEKIREDCFYKIHATATAYLINAEGHITSNYFGTPIKLHVVDELPPSGEAFVDGPGEYLSRYVAYFCTADRGVYAWWSTDNDFNFWAWYPLADLLEAIEGGTIWREISSSEEVTERGVLYILVPRAEKGLFHHDGTWYELVNKAELDRQYSELRARIETLETKI